MAASWSCLFIFFYLIAVSSAISFGECQKRKRMQLIDICDVNNTCPPERSFILVNEKMHKCLSSCGQGMVGLDLICIPVRECCRSIVHKGLCLNKCPVGYVYFPTNPWFPKQTAVFGYNSDEICDDFTGEENLILCQTVATYVGVVVLQVILVATFCFILYFLWLYPFQIRGLGVMRLRNCILHQIRRRNCEIKQDTEEPVPRQNLNKLNNGDLALVV